MKGEGRELSIQDERKRIEYTGKKEENRVYRIKREGRESSIQDKTEFTG